MTTPYECVDDLMAKLKTITDINGKVFHVYTKEDLKNQTAQISYPAIGVIYEGMRSKPENPPNTKQGLSAEVYCAVVLLVAGTSIVNLDLKESAMGILETVRKAVLKTKSPSGHFWSFMVETPVESDSSIFAYYTRFSTTIIL